MKEIWKDINNYERLYQVSNLGNVRSLKNNKIKLLKGYKNKDGYLQVSLYKNSEEKKFYIHRLVADAFLDNINKYEFIDHINTIRDDNAVFNLRWVDSKLNNNNELTKKHMSKSKSDYKHHNAKMVICVTTNEIFECIKYASNKYNVDGSAISKCCRNKVRFAGKLKDGTKLVWRYI